MPSTCNSYLPVHPVRRAVHGPRAYPLEARITHLLWVLEDLFQVSSQGKTFPGCLFSFSAPTVSTFTTMLPVMLQYFGHQLSLPLGLGSEWGLLLSPGIQPALLEWMNKQVNKTGNVFKCCLLQEVLPGRPGSICILCMYLLSVYPSRLSALKRQGPSHFIYRDLPGTSPGACHVA